MPRNRATRLLPYAIVLTAAVAAACRPEPTRPDDRGPTWTPYGLHTTILFSQQVQEGIAWVNAALPKEIAVRLLPAWDVEASRVAIPGGPPRGPAPRFVVATNRGRTADVSEHFDGRTETCTFEGATPVSVYLLDDARLSDVESLFVPEGTQTIIVNARSLPRLWGRLSTDTGFGGSSEEPTRIHAAIVGVFLLHEVGHLVFQDSGSYVAPARPDEADFFSPIEKIASKEVRADRFTTDRLLGDRRHDPDSCIEKFYGYGPALFARDARLAIRAAASAFDVRQDPFGVFDGVPKPMLFQKGSYSHPDLNLRFACMDALLFPELGTLNRLVKMGIVRAPAS